MPTYVYECQKCSSITEVEQRITEDALRDCVCGGSGTLVRLIQPPAVMFKGSGFYVNDSIPKCCEPNAESCACAISAGTVADPPAAP